MNQPVRAALAALLSLALAACATTAVPPGGSDETSGVVAGTDLTYTLGAGAAESVATMTPAVIEDVSVTATATTTLAGETPTPRATAILEALDVLTTTETYADEQGGFAIDYPASWTAEPFPGSMLILTSFSPDEPGRGGVREGDSKIDVAVDLPGETPPVLDDMAAGVRANTTVEYEEAWALAGDVPAVRFQTRLSAAEEMAIVLVVIGGRGVRVTGYGDLTLFDPIVRTLRAAP